MNCMVESIPQTYRLIEIEQRVVDNAEGRVLFVCF